MTHWEAGGEGAGKAFWSETQTDLKGGCVGLRSRGVCQRGQRLRQRGQFKKVQEGRCSMGSWGPHRAVQPPELCPSTHLILSELFWSPAGILRLTKFFEDSMAPRVPMS